MDAYSDLNRVAWLATALIAALITGCSTTENLNAAGPCVQGQAELCTCDSGAVGVRTCGNDSEYGQCRCEAPSSGASGGAAGVAGIPIGGSAGLSGSGGVGGTAGGGGVNPAAGVGGVAGVAGVTGGSAGAGIGGVSGMTAGTTGGSSGAGGTMTGGAGGVSGMEATGGMSGGGSGGNDGPGRDPKPGELYGECRDNGACDDGLLCVNDASSGVPESYCSTTCDALMPMPCPRSRGDGMVVCLFGICVR